MNNPIEPADASSMNCPNDINQQSYVRKRTRATAEQLAVLEDTFAVNVSPNSKLRKQLSEQLSMSERSIQIWFQNRRAKVKHMQKRAQMQMQQAAIRAQLYHYHQQHYGMMSPYGPPGAVPPTFQLQYHHPQQQQPQQPFYYPPPYIRNRAPLPRAQSVDALPYYGNQNDLARSSFPTPGPEPFMPNDCATPPPPGLAQMVPQHHQVPSMSSWSVSPCYPVLESPTQMSRQSMPPSFNPLSHTLVDNMDSATTGTLPSFHSEFGDAGNNASIHHLASFKEKHVLSEDFPDFFHGPMSPSLSPNREHFHPSGSYFDDSKQLSAERTNVTVEATPLDESDMWISSSPNIDSSEAVNKDVLAHDSDTSASPSHLTMTGSSPSAVAQDKDAKSHYLHATTLTIGAWHRLKLRANDLICLYKAEQQAFVWFIKEGGSRFKVEIPLTSILGIEYTPSVDNNGDSTSDIHFYMSQPPLFHMESQDETEDQWIQCSDFTENKQASQYLRHTLKGTQLKQDLVNLMNENEETRKLVYFLDAPSDSVNTPFLPSQQHSQLQQSPSSSIFLPSILPYPASSYYCYPNAASTSMSLTLNSSASLLATSEPPVSVGGFYA